ncbi:hypothetical protein M0R04_13410 [Candidatus Dojkabacteria bacterium]|jgi:hypothetical protein|nr:hypothetical protein [Candidatus Dojkabacteria bacterium]
MKNEKIFAYVPTHSLSHLIEGDNTDEVTKKVAEILKEPKKAYPNYNFEEHIVYIKGERYDREGIS